ncbi:MAG: hypothetical protein L0H70_00915, partial [Xanthomonadales bacterium]|nr:hypothetical protein [Xanthomonadales bacterium]
MRTSEHNEAMTESIQDVHAAASQHDAFVSALYQALRHFPDLEALRGNPLLGSRLVAERTEASESPQTAAQILREVIRDQCQLWAQSPKTAILQQALMLTYIEPMRSQQAVAEALNMSWSTYRRRLVQARELLTNQLWETERLLSGTPSDDAPQAKHSTGKLAFLAAVALLLIGAIIWLVGPWHNATTAPTAKPSIAVLPFENLSSDPDNAYFAAGIQDEILTRLASIGSMKVISRTSTMKYASRPANLKQVASELGVTTILEGSVQKRGKVVVIDVQLIDAKVDSHLWAHIYKRNMDNVFGVEGEVAAKIAHALKVKLSVSEAARIARQPTADAQAYNAFLRAEYQLDQGWARNDPVHMKAALPLYRKAVAVDPNFAVAWARLSLAQSIIAWWGGGGLSVPKLKASAREDALHAQQLAPDLTATQLALGYLAYYGEGDYDAALKAFHAALAERPNDTDAMAAIGYVLRRQQHNADAIAQFQRTLALDPRNAFLTQVMARTYVNMRRYDQALAPLRRAIALDPDNLFNRTEYAWALAAGTGDLKRALSVVQGKATPLKFSRVWLLTLARKYDAAIALLQSIPDTADNFQPGASK